MRLIKKADIILVLIILVLVIVVGFFKNTDDPCIAVIYVDGKEYMRVDLEEVNDQIIEFDNMLIYAHDGKIQINGADCPCGVCLNSEAIDKPGSVIACVPNKVVIEVIKNDNYVDGVTG